MNVKIIVFIVFILLFSSCKEEKKDLEVQNENEQYLEKQDTLQNIDANSIKPLDDRKSIDTLQYIGKSEYSDYFVSLFLTKNFEVISIVMLDEQPLKINHLNKVLIAKWKNSLVTAAGDSEVKFEMAFMEEFEFIEGKPFKLVTNTIDNNGLSQFQAVVLEFLHNVKTNNIEAIADATRYPLKRRYPLPSIKNKKQFINSYQEIFTDSLKKIILNSDLQTGWSNMRYKGVMLNKGVLWLDDEGKLIAINTLSSSEKNKRKIIIENEKKRLHNSVNRFDRPELLWETETFRIRIDRIGDKYRYVAWKKDKKENEKPDLILNDGVLIISGTARNHHYEFNNGIYKYECHIIILGENGHPPGWLQVYKSGNEILKEEVIKVFNE